jgi:hypothetical protein
MCGCVWVCVCVWGGDKCLLICSISFYFIIPHSCLSSISRYKFLKKVPLLSTLADDVVARIAGTLEVRED